MRQRKITIVALALFASVVGVAASSAATNSSNVHIEHEWMKHPKPERVVKKFIPPADTSGSYIRNVIIPYEAERYHTSPIYDRVECESSYNDQAFNGTYGGLIQTDGAFWYDGGAWPSVVSDHDLGIVFKTKKRVTRNVYRVRLWDTGKKTYKRIRTQQVRRVVIKRGKLPTDADWYHAWAAIRVGTRAVAGVGPTTYWACSHVGTGHY